MQVALYVCGGTEGLKLAIARNSHLPSREEIPTKSANAKGWVV